MTSNPVSPMGWPSVKVCNILFMTNSKHGLEEMLCASCLVYQGKGGRLRHHSVGMVPVTLSSRMRKKLSQNNGNITLACLDNIRTWG